MKVTTPWGEVVTVIDDVPTGDDLDEVWETFRDDLGEVWEKFSPPSSVVNTPALSTSTLMASRGGTQDVEVARPHKRPRLFNSLGKLFILHVGNEKAFKVHRDVLLEASSVLARDCELYIGGDGALFLDDECPQTIQTLCCWMYEGRICLSQEVARRSSQSHPNPLQTAPGIFVKLYLAGVKFQIPELRNDTIDAILSCCRASDLVRLSTHIYANTKPGSRLRKLLVKMVTYRYGAEDLQKDKSEICPELLFDLALMGYQDRDKDGRYRNQTLPQENFCARYHTHEEGSGACKKLRGPIVVDG